VAPGEDALACSVESEADGRAPLSRLAVWETKDGVGMPLVRNIETCSQSRRRPFPGCLRQIGLHLIFCAHPPGVSDAARPYLCMRSGT
jgi:hypothetical protein